jgi:hydrogenase maturation protease
VDTSNTTTAFLVLGYGNELRGDDAAGPHVAREVTRLHLPGVKARAVQQLTPELAEPLSEAAVAVFVDAALGGTPGTVEVTRCGDVDLHRPLGHIADPSSLLALAAAVFGRAPAAWLVKVHVSDLEVREGLSAAASRGVAVAVDAVQALMIRLRQEAEAEPHGHHEHSHEHGEEHEHGREHEQGGRDPNT